VLEKFLLAFIPLFVAIDILGVIPLFLSLTEGMEERRRRVLISQATATAFGVAIVFLFAGKLIFSFIGITVNDFRIGGGIVLLVLAVRDLIFPDDESRNTGHTDIGVVPIGIPLIIGPAVLTTVIILVDTCGYLPTISALIVNLIIVWLAFRQSKRIRSLLSDAGAKGFAKVASLFLAAIAVMMIRVGIMDTIGITVK
jgi:multiple antibiotic resistance protein